MSANPDIICHEAPAPEAPEAKSEAPAPAEPGGSRTKLLIGIALFALAAGVAVSFMAMRAGGGSAAASVKTEAATETDEDEPAKDVATATDTGAAPAECAGEIADAQLRWYCTQFLPFAKKASADHDRLDRLEAAGKSSGSPGVPVALWVVVIGIGLLTVYNTVKVHSSPRDKPPNG